MSKIIKSELQKLFYRPAIYIIFGLLILVMCLTAFLYKTPDNKPRYEYNYDSTTALFTYYTNNIKDIELDEIDIAEQNVEDYFKNSVKFNYELAYYEFNSALVNYTLATDDTIDSYYSLVYNRYVDLQNILEYAFNNSDLAGVNSYQIMITYENWESLKQLLIDIRQTFNTTLTDGKLEYNEKIRIYNEEYKDKLESLLDKIYLPNVSNDSVDRVLIDGDIYKKTMNRLSDLDSQITNLNSNVSTVDEQLDEENIKALEDLVLEYQLTADMYIELTDNLIVANTFDYDEDVSKYKGCQNLNVYRAHEIKNTYIYAYDEDEMVLVYDYASPFKLGISTNTSMNAYDYAFGTVAIFSVIVIIYSMISCGVSIAGERRTGTLKFIATRPVSRVDIYFGKYFANIIMGLILILASLIISFVIGVAMYGTATSGVLIAISAKYATCTHPFMMLLIFAICMFVMLSTLSSISMMLTAIFNNDILASIINFIIMLYVFVLPVALSSTKWYKYTVLPTFNLFGFFGGAGASSGSLASLIAPQIYSGVGLLFTIINIILTIAITSIIGVTITRRKEI